MGIREILLELTRKAEEAILMTYRDEHIVQSSREVEVPLPGEMNEVDVEAMRKEYGDGQPF